LQKGEEAEIVFNVLFTDNVLEITEGTKVSSEISIEYSFKGKKYTKKEAVTIRMYDRNAITWDDDIKWHRVSSVKTRGA